MRKKLGLSVKKNNISTFGFQVDPAIKKDRVNNIGITKKKLQESEGPSLKEKMKARPPETKESGGKDISLESGLSASKGTNTDCAKSFKSSSLVGDYASSDSDT